MLHFDGDVHVHRNSFVNGAVEDRLNYFILLDILLFIFDLFTFFAFTL